MAISKSRRGSCFSSRNRNRLLPSPLDLHLGLVLFLALLASCSALAIESSTLPTEVNEATTIIPAQTEESTPTPTSINQNETSTSAHPLETPKAETIDSVDSVQSSGVEVPAGFVSVYGGTLEQDIKNDVNSEVEEAPSPAEPLKESASNIAEVETVNRETEAAVQNAREPKTLEAEEEERKPGQEIALEDQTEPEAVTDNIAVSSEQVESRSSKPLPAVTSDLVSVFLNEDRAITEQPITKTILLALEQEHEAIEAENSSTPVPTYEEPKHQVTKKQGVENLLPIEVAPEVEEEPETAREERQFEEPNSSLNEIDENSVEGDKTIQKALFKSAAELQEKIEKATEEEAKAEIEEQVEGTAPPPETVVEAADSEDTQPEEEEVIPGTTEEIISEETKPIEEEAKEDEIKEKEPKVEEPKAEEPKEEEVKEEEPKAEEPKEEEPKVEEPKVEEPKVEEPKVEEPKDEEPKELEANEEKLKEEEPQEEVTIHQIDEEEPIILASPSPTEHPVEKKVSPKIEAESVEDKEEEPESVEDKEDKDKDGSNSSEEEKEPVADEAKPSSSDDSTATPLVSYPPHDAGQTFDSNSADEHSAQLSGPSNYRSTLIIALCSGTAVIFIVASLVIFVVSFQRQHGTLDIEMQEQRLGKDDRDEEDAQVKLLEVDLSTPVIVSLGNEETDECL